MFLVLKSEDDESVQDASSYDVAAVILFYFSHSQKRARHPPFLFFQRSSPQHPFFNDTPAQQKQFKQQQIYAP